MFLLRYQGSGYHKDVIFAPQNPLLIGDTHQQVSLSIHNNARKARSALEYDALRRRFLLWAFLYHHRVLFLLHDKAVRNQLSVVCWFQLISMVNRLTFMSLYHLHVYRRGGFPDTNVLLLEGHVSTEDWAGKKDSQLTRFRSRIQMSLEIAYPQIKILSHIHLGVWSGGGPLRMNVAPTLPRWKVGDRRNLDEQHGWCRSI